MNQFNLITTMNSVEPNYDVSSEEIHFEIYVSVSVEQEVCIVGKIDNNYICWCSITKATKQDTNTEIFNYLLSHLDERLY